MDMSKNWTSAAFSDENKFNLDSPDGYDWRRNRPLRLNQNFDGGSAMCWTVLFLSIMSVNHLIKMLF